MKKKSKFDLDKLEYAETPVDFPTPECILPAGHRDMMRNEIPHVERLEKERKKKGSH